MKIIVLHRKLFFLLVLLLTTLNITLFSQGTDSRGPSGGGKQKKFCMTVFVNPSRTGISSEVAGLSGLKSTKGGSLHGILDFDYFFAGAAGISFGIGYSGFSSQLSLDSWSDKYTTKDSENETYEMRITGKTIVEDQKIGYLSIPVCFSLRLPASGKFGVYLKTGIGFDIPLVKSYEGTGVFTYDGYYAAYPVLLQGVSAYGFYTNLSTDASGDLQVKSFSLALIASGDIFLSLGESMQILLGFNYNRSLSDISSYETSTDFMVSSKANELNSFMAGSTGASVNALGLSIGLRFYLK
jgi:hypothetical protein